MNETEQEGTPPDSTQTERVSKEKVWEALGQVHDPELHMSITELGLVYGVDIRGGDVDVEMTLTSPGCPYGPQLLYAVDHAVRSVEGVTEASVNVVWDPPWGPDRMTEAAKLELGFDL